MLDITTWDSPRKVVIAESRWHVRISITDSEGVEHRFVASAERFKTEGTATYLVTEAEFEKGL